MERTAGGEVNRDELVRLVVDRPASFKVPREARIVSDWPMGTTKIDSLVLRQWTERKGRPI